MKRFPDNVACGQGEADDMILRKREREKEKCLVIAAA